MEYLTKELRTLFNAVDPLRLYGHGREHEYDRAIERLEARLGGHESPEHVNELLEDVFHEEFGPRGEGDYVYLASEIAELLAALGV